MEAQIKIHDNGLNASLTVKRKENESIEVAALQNALKDEGVIFGIDEKVLKQLTEDVNSIEAGEEVSRIVANGTPPVEGKAGQVEILVDQSKKDVGEVDEHGNIDFHERGGFNPVSKDDLLAVLTPPTEGQKGKDVFGKEVLPKRGKKGVLPRGNGTKITGDGNELRAARDGELRVSPKHIEVMELIRVSGNLDYHTGNIDCEGSVQVDKDVLPGFSITAGGDVRIGGSVDSAVVKAKGRVEIGHSVVRRSSVVAGGPVVIGFLSQSFVESNEDVTIRRESNFSTVNSGGRVLVSGNGRVMGGGLFGKQRVEVGVAGHSDGKRTVLAAGIDGFANMKKARLQTNLKDVRSAMTRMDRLGRIARVGLENKIEEIIGRQHEYESKIEEKLEGLEKEQVPKIEEKLEGLEKEKAPKIDKKIYVRVAQKIYEGVQIQVGEGNYLVKEEREGGTFVYDEETKEVISLRVGKKT